MSDKYMSAVVFLFFVSLARSNYDTVIFIAGMLTLLIGVVLILRERRKKKQ